MDRGVGWWARWLLWRSLRCGGGSVGAIAPQGAAVQSGPSVAFYARCACDDGRRRLCAGRWGEVEDLRGRRRWRWATPAGDCVCGRAAFNMKIADRGRGVFEISGQRSVRRTGTFSLVSRGQGRGEDGIKESALTSEVSYTDLVHGLAGAAIHGATGVGRSWIGSISGRCRMRGSTWTTARGTRATSRWAGGLVMRGSAMEFSGCVEDFPVRHQVPMVECRDQEMGGHGDGDTTGDWVFDHDAWRYNFRMGSICCTWGCSG